MRVLYLNPFSQEVSGPDESLRGLLARADSRPASRRTWCCRRRDRRSSATGRSARRCTSRRSRCCAAICRWTRGALSGAARARGGGGPRASRVAWARTLIHTNMEVLLEGGLAARALRHPHVLHYRGNTLDRPKLGVRRADRGLDRRPPITSTASRARRRQVFERRGRAAKVEVLYNPVDVDALRRRGALGRRAALRWAPDPAIGWSGRSAAFIRARTSRRSCAPPAQVARRRPDVALRDRRRRGGADRADDYQQRLDGAGRASWGSSGRVTFAGARRDMPAVMAALDVFVLSSRHEGFGRVVAEAMAAGRPMVVSDEGAPPELVERGRYGLCRAARRRGGLREQICAPARRSPAAAAAMAARARERAAAFDAAHRWRHGCTSATRAARRGCDQAKSLRPALQRREREQLPADVLARKVAVRSARRSRGVEPERRAPARLRRAARAVGGRRLAKPAIDGDLEAALGAVGEARAQLGSQQPRASAACRAAPRP